MSVHFEPQRARGARPFYSTFRVRTPTDAEGGGHPVLVRGWSWPRQLYAISAAAVSRAAAFDDGMTTTAERLSIVDAADPIALRSDDPFALLDFSLGVVGADVEASAAASAAAARARCQQIALTFGAEQSDASEARATVEPLGVVFGSVANCGAGGSPASGSFSIVFTEGSEAGGAFASLFSVDKVSGSLAVGASETVLFTFLPPRDEVAESSGGKGGKGAGTAAVQPEALRVPQWVQTTAVATLTGGFVPASATGEAQPTEIKIDIVLRAFAWLSSS